VIGYTLRVYGVGERCGGGGGVYKSFCMCWGKMLLRGNICIFIGWWMENCSRAGMTPERHEDEAYSHRNTWTNRNLCSYILEGSG
jgi:hypothetical protein